MKKIEPDDPFLQEISIDDIHAYLLETIWTNVEQPNSRLIVFEGPRDNKGKPVTLILPRNKDFIDSNERIADAINLIAAIERTTPYKVVQEIQSIDSDTIQMRMLLLPGNFPSLEKATQIVQGLRDLIAFSACMEKEPKPFFKKPLPEGQWQAQLCRFGHTFAGSFGFTIESPIYTIQPPLLDIPVSRKVIERIIRGLSFAHRAAQERNSAIISQTFEIGLNSNMCSALVEISQSLQDIEFEYTISWSPRLRPSNDIIEIRTIHLPSSTSQYLTEAATSLKGEVSEAILMLDSERGREETSVQGTIVELKTLKNGYRTITLLSEDQVRIHITLEQETYQMACDAHRDNRLVSVKGKITKKNRNWILENPHDFIAE